MIGTNDITLYVLRTRRVRIRASCPRRGAVRVVRGYFDSAIYNAIPYYSINTQGHYWKINFEIKILN